MSNAIKAYELFPHWGSFSTKTVDYNGTKYTVAATSMRQAYALAHQSSWIHPTDERPVGILSIYRRATGTTLWCGCSGHNVTGGQARHGAGVRAIRKAVEAHDCPNRVASLRDRLQAAAVTTEQREA